MSIIDRFKAIFLCTFFMISFGVVGQEKIEGTMTIMGQQKTYALYIPSSYSNEDPNPAMLGLHPWNPARWDAVSWRDTLTAFCEENGLILFCPDGGADGQVDDTVDTLLANQLTDSVMTWYNIDADRMYAMGFSWGARTLFTYALRHADRFAGFIPIGTAINSIFEIDNSFDQATGKPFYLIHGSQDNPNTRFYPVRDELLDNEACVEWMLLDNVGHTIDFPNRNLILTSAFAWVDSINCGMTTSVPGNLDDKAGSLNYYPNPIRQGENLFIELEEEIDLKILIHRSDGSLVGDWENITSIPTNDLMPGLYLLSIWNKGIYYPGKLVIL